MSRPEAEVAELPTDPGARLRRQRELAELSEQFVAEQLNLDVSAVTALERDDFAALGAPVFARGHLKRYAAVLGLAEEDILGAYERSRAQLGQPTLIPKSRMEMPPERGPARWPWIVGSLLLFLMAAGIAAYIGEYGLRLPAWPFGRGAATGGAAEVTAAAAVQPAPTVEPPAQQMTEAPVVAPTVDATGSTATAAVPAGLPPGEVMLQLRFAADSWVEIYDGSGKTVLYDLGKAGSDRTVTGLAPLSMTFGNAPAVTLQANGRAVSLPAPPAGQTVGRYSMGADGALR